MSESEAIARARVEAREVVAVLREQRNRLRAIVARLRRAARTAETISSAGGHGYTAEKWAAGVFALSVEDLTNAARILAREARCDFVEEILRSGKIA